MKVGMKIMPLEDTLPLYVLISYYQKYQQTFEVCMRLVPLDVGS